MSFMHGLIHHSWHKDDTYSAAEDSELPVCILCKFLDYTGGVRLEGFPSLYFREASVEASMFRVKSSTCCPRPWSALVATGPEQIKPNLLQI